MKNEKHLVTCGDCGKLNEVNMDEEEYKCGACDYISEPCDFPDYEWESKHWENLATYNERFTY